MDQPARQKGQQKRKKKQSRPSADSSLDARSAYWRDQRSPSIKSIFSDDSSRQSPRTPLFSALGAHNGNYRLTIIAERKAKSEAELEEYEKGCLFFSYSLLSSLSMIDAYFDFFFLSFVTTQSGIPTYQAGALVTLASLINLIFSPFTSFFVDKFYFPSLGKHRTWLLAMIFPTVISFALLWYIPPFLSSSTSRIWYFIVVLTVNSCSYSTLLVVFEGTLPLITVKESEVTSLNARRLAIGNILSLLPAILGSMLVPSGSVSSHTAVYFVVASCTSVFILLCYLLFIVTTLESDAGVELLLKNALEPMKVHREEGLSLISKPSHLVGYGSIQTAHSGQDLINRLHQSQSSAPVSIQKYESYSDPQPSTGSKRPYFSIDMPFEASNSRHSMSSLPTLHEEAGVNPSSLTTTVPTTEPISHPPSSSHSKEWWDKVKVLLKEKSFLVLIAKTVVFWGLYAFSNASAPFYVSKYLHLNTYTGTLDGTFFVYFLNQLGIALSQLSISRYFEYINLPYCLRGAIVCLLVLRSLAWFMYDYVPPVVFLPVVLLDGIALGALFTTVEIMVPEVILVCEYKREFSQERPKYFGAGSGSGAMKTVDDDKEDNTNDGDVRDAFDDEDDEFSDDEDVLVVGADADRSNIDSPDPEDADGPLMIEDHDQGRNRNQQDDVNLSSDSLQRWGTPADPSIAKDTPTQDQFHTPVSRVRPAPLRSPSPSPTSNSNSSRVAHRKLQRQASQKFNKYGFEDVVYSFVNCCRDIGFAVSFAILGVLLDDSNSSSTMSIVRIKLCYCVLPLLMLLSLLLIHLHHPQIKFSDILLSSTDI